MAPDSAAHWLVPYAEEASMATVFRASSVVSTRMEYQKTAIENINIDATIEI